MERCSAGGSQVLISETVKGLGAGQRGFDEPRGQRPRGDLFPCRPQGALLACFHRRFHDRHEHATTLTYGISQSDFSLAGRAC